MKPAHTTDILIVDDEPLQREILGTILSEEGYNVFEAGSGAEAIGVFKENNPQLVLTDLKMPDLSGLELIERIQSLRPKQPPAVIIMTAYGTISSAVEAIKNGAFDYLTKPLDKDALLLKIRQAVERNELLRENLYLRETLYERFRIDGIIGESSKMKTVIDTLRKVSPTNATVLIRGESGTGKELVARAIHFNSPRRTKPFTAINCASIPENLLESELFGYEPGAFTGATSRKKGLIESTDGGTLFLDEIGDMPANLQAKLLRVLQDGEVRRVGGKESFRVNIRTIAATHQNIEELIGDGKFREDLYYRLKVVTINLPPLRERRKDIPLLSDYFLRKYNEEFGKRVSGIEEKALTALIDYRWPGNIRELESVIERAIIMSECSTVTYSDIKDELPVRKDRGSLDIEIPDDGIVFEDIEKELMRKAMERTNYVAKRAAELLGMSYKTFWYRWEKFGLGKNKKGEK
ncbi:MAG TPA: sigma-54-dependent Fis family transcriptional regulator [Nitrospirae bacterium]|nr:sigma-54-dependent Fis family transcriptional regulator [Nitrospirota bacterium]